jgi:hypothetical protein
MCRSIKFQCYWQFDVAFVCGLFQRVTQQTRF